MKSKLVPSLLLSAMALASTFAFAADELPAPVKSAVDNGLKFERSFPAASGITGWMLSQGPNNNVILYTTATGDVAIAGNMFDAKGNNLTKTFMEKYAPKPDYEKMWGELESSAWIAEGPKTKDAKAIVYVFEDSNCGYCHLAWKALQPYEKVGLQVRWIPVAFLAPDSAAKAQGLMTAPDANLALADAHANFGKKLTSPPAVAPEIKAKLDANAKLMKTWGFTGTPATFYKDKATGKVKAINGMFSLAEIPAMTGLPEQKNTDPDLAHYR